jgi:hypothetical protein
MFSIVFTLLSLKAFAIPSAPNDFEGKWLSMNARNQYFTITQNGSLGASVSNERDKISNIAVKFNVHDSIPSSAFKGIEGKKLMGEIVHVLSAGKYLLKLRSTADRSELRGPFTANFSVGEGKKKQAFLISGTATASVPRKKQTLSSSCSDIFEPRTMEIRLGGFSIAKAVPKAVKSFLSSSYVNSRLENFSYTDTLIEMDPEPQKTFSILEQCNPLKPLPPQKCSP